LLTLGRASSTRPETRKMMKQSFKTINKKNTIRVNKRIKTKIMMRGGLPLEEEPLFWWSNLMEVNDEEPLFVLELIPEDKERARECHAAMAENITKV
jgi:hypothetical protein